ncbi:MAG: hypothetical protein R3F11_09715 [Verrucomicrobiales bacterium]
MNQRIHLIGSLAGVFLASPVLAEVTVNYLAQPGMRRVEGASGDLLSGGHEVRIGHFPAGFDVATNAGDAAALGEAWLPYDSTEIGVVFGEASRFTAAVAAHDDATFAGKKIYLWILRTSDGAPPSANFINVREYGIFSSAADNWRFPSSSGIPGLDDISVASSEATETFGGFGSLTPEALRLTIAPQILLSYAEWAAAAFPEDTPADDRLPQADPEGDRLSNAEEYLGNLRPLIADPLPYSIEIAAGDAAIIYRRAKYVPPGIGKPQGSTDLSDWSEGGFTESPLGDESGVEIIRAVVDYGDADAFYLRFAIDVD